MRPKLGGSILVLAGLALCNAAQAEPVPVEGVTQNADGITLRMRPGAMKLQVWSERSIRVQYAPLDTLPDTKSLAVIGVPDGAKWSFKETADSETVSTALVQVKVNRANGAVIFCDAAGKTVLAEAPEAGKRFGPTPVPSLNAKQAQQAFKLRGDEAIYGLGQHQNGLLNYHGSIIHLQQANTDVAVPMLVSGNGYGIFWDNPSVTEVQVGSPFADRITFTSEVADAIDYYYLAGPALDDVVGSYRKLTGPAPLMARWTWGLWQSKERYASQAELLSVAARYRKMGVPLDGIVQDWQYWSPNQWGSQEFDPKRYPDPAEMMRQLHDQHVHAIISVWPKFDVGTANLREFEQAAAVYPTTYPSVFPKGENKWYDPFNPTGRQLYWQQILKHLGSAGLDGWWLDASEPELGGNWGEYRSAATGAGPGAAVYNAYPLMHTTGVSQGARAEPSQKRVFILTRSAYAGQQRNSAVTWSGDIRGTWEVFRRQIPAGLNFSISGIPYWNTDIGGFFGGKPSDPNYRELFVRWYQFGAFCPMFRVHGTGAGKEIWQFDEESQKVLLAADQLRYRLLPYIYSVSWRVTNQGYTMMRPLAMDFRSDPLVMNVATQYMFGPALLVNPVVEPRVSSRNVYLPAGCAWYDFWTGKRYEGGIAVDAAAPIQTIPLFVRGGSIVPMGPVVQYAEEQPGAPLELRVYRGADASFELYEDEGDNYSYEKGSYATIPLNWSEAAKTLTIGKRAGDFPGMVKQRQFKIVWVGEGHGVGLSAEGNVDQTIDYDGKATTIEAR